MWRRDIAVLTNGEPVDLADSVSFDFLDTAQHGEPTEDWLELTGQVYEQEAQKLRSPTDCSKPPEDASDPHADSTYTGTYTNAYYGPLIITEANGDLTRRLGPKPTAFRLTHYAGDTFSFETVGENATGPSGATFKGDENGKTTEITIEAFDANGLGTFRRS
ncbi:DUF3471 domain-containing protein [Streptomyces sp. NPDC002787]